MQTRHAFLAIALSLAPLAFADAQPRPRLLFDRAHGENEPTPPMVAAAERAGLEVAHDGRTCVSEVTGRRLRFRDKPFAQTTSAKPCASPACATH
jgi:hypothetical protein